MLKKKEITIIIIIIIFCFLKSEMLAIVSTLLLELPYGLFARIIINLG